MDSVQVKKLGREALLQHAVKLLERRPLTERELRARLERKARSESDVDEAVNRLLGLRYLSDSRTAESHAYGRREFQGFGKRRVLEELRQRGVSERAAEKAVEEAYDGVDEGDLIREFLKRKMPSARFEHRKTGKRAVERLLRAGFSSGRILEALRGLAPGAEWTEELDESDLEPSGDL